jgi:hypothetical protein
MTTLLEFTAKTLPGQSEHLRQKHTADYPLGFQRVLS